MASGIPAIVHSHPTEHCFDNHSKSNLNLLYKNAFISASCSKFGIFEETHPYLRGDKKRTNKDRIKQGFF